MRNNQPQQNSFQKQPRRSHQRQRWEIDMEIAQEKRRQEEGAELARKNALEQTVENYPPLANAQVVKSKWAGDRKFTDLASEWSSTSAIQKEEEEIAKSRSRNQEYSFILPRFQNIHRFEEPEDNEIQESANPIKEDEDGWNTVKRIKVRKLKQDKTLLELEKETAESSEPDETVWNQPQEYETCWD